MTPFAVVPGKVVDVVLEDSTTEIVDRVRQAYLLHAAGQSVNPDSYFLRFPEKPDARIIALPAYLAGDIDLAGLKWIASFPGNVRTGLPRASAVLILNDYTTGYPIALLESAGISAARTAASAALACSALGGRAAASVGVVGAGVIARTICRYLADVGVAVTDVRCHDLHEPSAKALVSHLRQHYSATARVTGLDEALDGDVVVLATTALEPYVPATYRLRPGQLVLNVSLRDLAPEVLLTADNVLDDVDHCLRAGTSPHLAEQLTGNRDFVTGTLAEVLRGDLAVDPNRPTVFSPFGLGVLDLAIGHLALERARAAGQTVEIPGFFGTLSRW